MRFEFIGGTACLDFANTIHNSRAEDPGEELQAIADVLHWGREAGLLSSADHDRLAAHYAGKPREAAAALARSIAIRDLLLSIFTGIPQGRRVSARCLSELNSALARAPGLLRARKKADWIEREWTSASGGLPRILFAVLTSAADLLASDRLGRIRQCASPDCTWLFVDVSRNGSRRWCNMRDCGNRMKARRHYERARADRSPGVGPAAGPR